MTQEEREGALIHVYTTRVHWWYRRFKESPLLAFTELSAEYKQVVLSRPDLPYPGGRLLHHPDDDVVLMHSLATITIPDTVEWRVEGSMSGPPHLRIIHLNADAL